MPGACSKKRRLLTRGRPSPAVSVFFCPQPAFWHALRMLLAVPVPEPTLRPHGPHLFFSWGLLENACQGWLLASHEINVSLLTHSSPPAFVLYHKGCKLSH